MTIDKKLIHFKTKENFMSANGVNGNPNTPTSGSEETGNAEYGQIKGTSIVFIKDSQEIWTHGQLYSCSDPDLSNFVTKEELEELEKLSAPMISVTYNELKTLRDNSQLILGQQYRITDYVTTTSQADTQSAGHQFDVIVLALSENTLAEEACAIQREFNIEDYKDAYSPSWSERMAYIGTYEYRGEMYHRYESASQDMQILVDFKTITFNAGWADSNDLKEIYPFVFTPTFTRTDEDWDTGENFGEVIAFKNYPEYFANSNLAAWQIWYSIDNDAERFAWADTENGKGVIYRMIDEWNNDCPYDFKNIMFKRFAVTKYDKTPSLVVDNEENYCGYYYGALSLFGRQAIQEATYGGDFVWVHTFALKDLATDTWHDYTILNSIGLKTDESVITCHSNIIKEHRDEFFGEYGRKTILLNNIVFFNCHTDISSLDFADSYSYCYSNSFGNDCESNTFGNNCYSNSFGNGCYNNSFGESCYHNTFGNYCHNNTFGNDCYINSFDNDCYNNIFRNSCYKNTFGNRFNNNTFGNSCCTNSFGNDCSQNSFGNSCYYNRFDIDCRVNAFGNNCRYNSFGNGCYNNSFSNNCSQNSFGNGCYYNEFGNYCYNNSFGNGCYMNSFEYECHNNSFGNECYENSLGGSCDSNSFGDVCCENSLGFYCDFNSFGNYCDSNDFGNYCCYNSFGNGCYSNRFGYYCYSNSFGNECCYNSFRSSASKTASLKDYCHYNHFDDGCRYNVIWNSNTTSSSNRLQNINVNRGVSGKDSNYNFINIDTIKSEQEININQVDGIVSIGEVLSIRYESLKTLRDNSKLIPGRQYRIIDYITTTSQENTTSAEHQFDIIVTAIDEYTLSEEAQAVQNINNGYFDDSNLSAWKIWYSLDNDTERFAWAGHERIETTKVEVLDTSNCTISVGYSFDEEEGLNKLDNWVRVQGKVFNDPADADFYEEGSDMNEIFSHWGYTEDANGITQLTMYARDIDGDLDDEWEDVGLNLGERYHYKGVDIVNGVEYDIWAQLSDTSENGYSQGSLGPVYVLTERIVSGEPTIITNTIETVIPLEPKGVIYRMIDEFGNDIPYDFKNIKFKHPNDPTTYPDYYYTFSTVINDVVTDHSLLQDYCYDNTMKEYITSKKQHLNNNVFLNTSKTSISCNNSFGNNCYSNSLGNGCRNNTLGNNCYNNSFGDECYNNSFGNGCDNNSFGDECYNNSFGNYGYNNSFGNLCRYNSLGNELYRNSFGNDCRDNFFGNGCYYNSFGNGCNSNSFGNNCNSNSFGYKCEYNSFGNFCISNSFGNCCISNSFGNGCKSNSFRISADSSSSLKNYVQYNHFDDGCSYNVIWNSDTTSSSVQLKNININRGISSITGGLAYTNMINITTLNQDYEIQVAKSSKGEIKIYCEADLIA